jgi:hypothetical protein
LTYLGAQIPPPPPAAPLTGPLPNFDANGVVGAIRKAMKVCQIEYLLASQITVFNMR